jgi:hypothetical protein
MDDRAHIAADMNGSDRLAGQPGVVPYGGYLYGRARLAEAARLSAF